MRDYIRLSKVEGTASRQAHTDLPEGTYEREMSKEGFFGPAAHLYHQRPPTGWIDWEGPLRPRAFDLNRLNYRPNSPFEAASVLHNAHVKLRFWRASGKMERLARNGDGDELLFVHDGAGQLFCDFGRLDLRAGDYVMLPRGTMWRTEFDGDADLLMIEATNDSYHLPDKGLVGHHAIFDPAMLDSPVMDDGLPGPADPGRERGGLARRHQAPRRPVDGDLPLQPARRRRLEGRPDAGEDQRRALPPADEPPLPPAAVGPHHLRRRSGSSSAPSARGRWRWIRRR